MQSIVCIGAGKLANQLMPALEHAGYDIVQVYSRTTVSSNALASSLKNTAATNDINGIQKGADIYFFALKDDVMEAVAKKLDYLANEKSVFVHTSGILPLSAIPFKRRGIFYPLQTFSPNHQVDWKKTPILVTGVNEEITSSLQIMAEKISDLVYKVGDDDRAALHVAAVFANNFTNHMLTLAEIICKEHHVSFEILKPIIRETIAKALEAGPANSQTGPAVRGDQHTIDKHLSILKDDPRLQKLYKALSESIMRMRD